jgi:hemerythrin-like metal-binding protein
MGYTGQMNLLKWDETFTVFDAGMDAQHKELINILNLLDVAISEGREKGTVDFALQRMMEYSILHFSDEEELMRKINYEGLETHLGEHAAYIKYVTGATHSLWDHKPGLPAELLTFLRIWWKNHITGSDKKYGLLLKGR